MDVWNFWSNYSGEYKRKNYHIKINCFFMHWYLGNPTDCIALKDFRVTKFSFRITILVTLRFIVFFFTRLDSRQCYVFLPYHISRIHTRRLRQGYVFSSELCMWYSLYTHKADGFLKNKMSLDLIFFFGECHRIYELP